MAEVETLMPKVNIAEKFTGITEFWKPYIAAELDPHGKCRLLRPLVPGLPGGEAFSRPTKLPYTDIDIETTPGAADEVVKRPGKHAIPSL
jgi:hypothetical protein